MEIMENIEKSMEIIENWKYLIFLECFQLEPKWLRTLSVGRSVGNLSANPRNSDEFSTFVFERKKARL